jgi:hypothetical protein
VSRWLAIRRILGELFPLAMRYGGLFIALITVASDPLSPARDPLILAAGMMGLSEIFRH